MKKHNYKWLLVAVLWLIAFLNYVDRQAIFSVLPSLRSDLGLSGLEISLLGSIFLWVYGLSSPIAGYIGDRWSRRAVVVTSLLLFSSATLLTGSANTALTLILFRAMLGISEALYLPAANALIAAFHPPESRSKAIGFHLSGLSIGAIAGGTLAGYMADRHGWRSVFYLLGSAGVFLGIGAWFILRDPGTDLTPEAGRSVPLPARLKRIVAKRTAVVIMFTGLCVSMAGWVLMSWLPFHLYSKFHLTMTQAGFDGTFYFLACTAIGSIAGSFVSDRWARQRADARLWMQIIGLAAFGPGLLLASASESESALLACLSLAGIGRGIWDCNNMPIFCEVLDPRDWSTAYGLFNLANVLGGGSAVFVAGALMASTGLNFVLGVFSALIMLSAMLTWFSVRSATPSTTFP